MNGVPAPLIFVLPRIVLISAMSFLRRCLEYIWCQLAEWARHLLLIYEFTEGLDHFFYQPLGGDEIDSN